MMKNIEIAKMFYEMADILELQGVEWKPAAYRKAARGIESISEDVEMIYKKGGIKLLEEIPGVGERLAKKIVEYIETGRIKEYERLTKTVPKGLEELMHVSGLGPKKAVRLYKELGIKSVEQLKKAAEEGKIRKLRGFGAKSEEDIKRALGFIKLGEQRMLLGKAIPIANEIAEKLRQVSGVQKVEVAGSLRRMKETVGDIDFLVIAKKPALVMDFFTKMPDVKAVLAKGPTKSMVLLKEGINSDVRVLSEKSFGAALQYFTGSKDHNIALRKIAMEKGMKLSEYGLFTRKGSYICGRTEKEIYAKLGLAYIEPELRENRGEIEAAMKNQLPKLLPYDALRGDLHIHTNWSEGNNTLQEVAEMAKKMGYEYIGIADHSQSQKIARGMLPKKALKQIEEIDKLNEKLDGITLLKGMEVDILPNGKLDMPDSVLKKLDFTICSVHSRFKSTREEMTKRILKAMDTGFMTILGHPTGRLINERQAYEINLEEVFEHAREKGIVMEINSTPKRLDLNDSNILLAKEHKLKFAINTDSHDREHMRFARLGIAQARRGWLEKNDVINTLPLKKLTKLLQTAKR